MPVLQLFTVTFEIPVNAFTEEQAQEKAKMILEAGREIPKECVRVTYVGPSRL